MCVCVYLRARVSGREVVRKVICYVIFVVYYYLRVAPTFSFWNKAFLGLTWLEVRQSRSKQKNHSAHVH